MFEFKVRIQANTVCSIVGFGTDASKVKPRDFYIFLRATIPLPVPMPDAVSVENQLCLSAVR